MSSCAVASISNSPVFSPSSSSSSSGCSPNSSSPRLIRLHKPSGLIRVLASGDSSSASILKRKRPPRLDIPVGSLVVGKEAAVLEDVVEAEGDGYSVVSKRGRRDHGIEDRYSAVIGKDQAFFGVYDGHGGATAAEFAAENLNTNIINELNRREQEGNNDGEIEEAVKSGYLTTDSEFLKSDLRGGACCVTAFIRRGSLVVSNAGDCRAVISRDGIAEALTSDHRPSRDDEKHRIEALDGFVECRNGIWRVLGSLAVSRSIGDRHLKQWITAEPETKVLKLEPEYEFLILASDGLWDKVSNQESVDIARSLWVDIEKPQLKAACRKLVDLSLSRGSTDDISVMIIHLGR